jgi:Imelysin
MRLVRLSSLAVNASHRFCAALVIVVLGAALASTTSAAATTPPGVKLAPTKSYLLEHTAELRGFTARFERVANRYAAVVRSAGSEAAAWRSKRAAMKPLLIQAKALWVEGNPYYERVEGIVAGTPSLALYDVILDAGSSADEDPASAVPFDLKLADGRVLRKPGNLYNLTEGMLWGTRPEFVARAAKPDLDADGRIEFGEVLPDTDIFKAAAAAFVLYAGKLDQAARAWKPSASDAFTAVVVMVPTMSEYFGQWKVSRFVLGNRAQGDAFNVVSRLNDIADILGGLRVIYSGVQPAIAKVDPQQAAQTKRELDALWRFVSDLRKQEQAGRRFTPQQADSLGRTAQERATAIAGQVTQAAARLKVKIVQ